MKASAKLIAKEMGKVLGLYEGDDDDDDDNPYVDAETEVW